MRTQFIRHFRGVVPRVRRAFVEDAASLVALFSIAICIMGCDKPAWQVHLVLPDDYNGYFWVLCDPDKGAAIEPEGNAITLKIPENGVLRLRDCECLREWHQLSAADYSGRKLKAYGFDTSNPDEVSVHSLSTDAFGTRTFLVGNYAAVMEYSHDSGKAADAELSRRLSRERK